MSRRQCTTRSCYNLMTSLKDLPTEHSSTNWWPKSLPSAPLPHESLTNTREVSASWQRNTKLKQCTLKNKTQSDAPKCNYVLGTAMATKKSFHGALTSFTTRRTKTIASDTTYSRSKQNWSIDWDYLKPTSYFQRRHIRTYTHTHTHSCNTHIHTSRFQAKPHLVLSNAETRSNSQTSSMIPFQSRDDKQL